MISSIDFETTAGSLTSMRNPSHSAPVFALISDAVAANTSVRLEHKTITIVNLRVSFLAKRMLRFLEILVMMTLIWSDRTSKFTNSLEEVESK